MKTVCIESPLAGDFARNIAYARAAMRFCLLKGVAPFASHLLYTQALDDENLEHRGIGIAAGLALGDQCDERWFFIDFGLSTGMGKAQDRAIARHQRKRAWRLGPDWETEYALTPTPGLAQGMAPEIQGGIWAALYPTPSEKG